MPPDLPRGTGLTPPWLIQSGTLLKPSCYFNELILKPLGETRESKVYTGLGMPTKQSGYTVGLSENLNKD